MSEEIEVPLESTQEELHHTALHGHENWITMSALLSAFLAVFAAITALLAGASSNEALIHQMVASDTWTQYQAKSIKASIVEDRMLLLEAKHDEAGMEKAKTKAEQYRDDLKELSEKAKELESESKRLLNRHETLATGVTFFQIAIGLTAIAVLSKRKKFVGVSLGFGVLGLILAIIGYLK
jgi:heme A synthase